MASEEELKIIIEAFAESAVKELQKVNQALQEQSAQAKAAASAQTKVAKIVATVTSIYTVAWQVFKKVIRETVEAEQVQVKLEAALRNSAQAASLNISELNNMAEVLSVTSIYSDEVIKGAQTMLLTFDRLGRETFPTVLQAAMDYASFSGRDLVGVTRQFAMSLEDPVGGMNRLRMAGVTFSEQQRQNIKYFQEHNNIAAAQKIIMDELSQKWAGQAAAAAKTLGGQLQILGNNINELFESGTTGDFTKRIVVGLNKVILAIPIVVAKIKEWYYTFSFYLGDMSIKVTELGRDIAKAMGNDVAVRGMTEQLRQMYMQELALGVEMVKSRAESSKAGEKFYAYEKMMATDTTNVKMGERQRDHDDQAIKREENRVQDEQYAAWGAEAALKWQAENLGGVTAAEKAKYLVKKTYGILSSQDFQTFSNFMMQSLDKSSKAEFKVWKAFSIIQATMDTYNAANAAYKAMAGIPFVGPALATAAAATAVAFGMRNVKKITAMQPPKAAAGGYIPGSSGGTHLIAGEGGRGEAILPLENPDAMDKIKGAFSGVTINLSGNIFARDDWPREIVMKIDRELYKLKQDRRSALFS